MHSEPVMSGGHLLGAHAGLEQVRTGLVADARRIGGKRGLDLDYVEARVRFARD